MCSELIFESEGNDGSESEETVSIRNIQFVDNAENIGLKGLSSM